MKKGVHGSADWPTRTGVIAVIVGIVGVVGLIAVGYTAYHLKAEWDKEYTEDVFQQ